MESHRPARLEPNAGDPEVAPRRRKRRDALPLDEKWLEDEAVASLARSDQSRQRLIDTLGRKLEERCARTDEDGEAIRAAIPGIVDRLVDRGYVDDHRLAAHLFERGRAAGRSRAWIERQLFAKGIEPSTLRELERARSEEATGSRDDSGGFAHTEEVEAALRIARKKRLGPFCPDPEKRIADRQRHLGFLARRGFSSDVAHHVIDAESAE
ncbi:MAG: RecX family transcriptional regulator [Myxococcota bacterium]